LEHKSGEIEGFASKYHCDRLIYYEDFDDVLKAIAREKQLKGWRRSKKIALIESANPRWEDLAEKWGAQETVPNSVILSGAGLHEGKARRSRKTPALLAVALAVPGILPNGLFRGVVKMPGIAGAAA
jgi:hypothetical protein